VTDEIRPISWRDGRVCLLDQRQLPGREEHLECSDWREVARAIADMAVRGAPAIGVAAAYGVALAAHRAAGRRDHVREACAALVRARPTAVNLSWAVELMRAVADETDDDHLPEALLAEARRIHEAQVEADRRLARHGANLVPHSARIAHICNTGALATGGYGTALGIIRAAHEQGKQPFVWVLETRPRLQGMRLTAWELGRAGIPYRVVTDGMVGSLMRRGLVDLALSGADRIAANGDTANKIGTYSLAALSHLHGVPFYVAAPLSTVDLAVPTGHHIPIEERAQEEITEIAGVRLAPEGAQAYNPSFDVTPHDLIKAIITEAGVLSAPFDVSLQRAAAASGSR
jgi:methylthioribose-1-phosphate isomerase